MISTPPRSQVGGAHADVIAVPHAHGLHQDQADAPRRQQRFEHAAIEVPHDNQLDQPADESGHEEGEGQGGDVIPVELVRRKMPREEELHFVRGISPEHHQFAVGHVDHAHLPVDDREAQRHQDQNRSGREPVGQIHAQADPVLVPLDRLDRLLAILPLVPFDLVLVDHLLQHALAQHAMQVGQRLLGFQFVLGLLVLHVGRKPRQCGAFPCRAPHARVGIGFGNVVQHRHEIRIRVLSQPADAQATVFPDRSS